MARRFAWLSAAAAAGLAVAAVSGSQSFRAGVAAVHVPVIVTDREGQPIRGLTAGDFEIRESGAVQAITSFAEGPPGPSVPLHLALMFDTSESMAKELAGAARLAVDLVDSLSEAADVTLVEFDSSVRISRFEPPSYPRLFERLRQNNLGQRTALFDAFGRYIAMVRERPGQHLLIVCTDGADSSFSLRFADVIDLLRLGDVMVYAVGYLNQSGGADRGRQQSQLSILARETGGEAFFPSTPADVGRITNRIRLEVDSRYTLGYVRPPGSSESGFRRIEVRLRRPGLTGTRVRARSGYR